MSLFSNGNAGEGGRSGNGPAVPSDGSLLSFKAGRMTQRGDQVEADPRKGLVILKRVDGLLNFQWRDRTTGTDDEPIILFPDEQKLLKCRSAPPEARVIYLKFANRREFLWMQEPDASKDDELVSKFNRIVNGTGDVSPDAGAGMGDMNPHEQAALMQMLSQNLGSPTTPGTGEEGPVMTPNPTHTPGAAPAAPMRPGAGEATSGAQLFDQAMLQNVLQGLAREANQRQGGARRGGPAASLTDVLNPANVDSLLQDPAVVNRLLSLLPEGANRNVDDLRENLRSPQYAQALAMFNAALQSGELDGAMGQFGVNPSTAAASGGRVEGLAAALQEAADQQRDGEEGDDKDGDEGKSKRSRPDDSSDV